MKTLKQQFKTLKRIRPDQAQKEEFAKLLAIISADYRNPRGFSFRRAPTPTLLLILFLVGSGAGISLASQSALPGDALYPAKLAIEKVRVVATDNVEKKTELRLEFAARRLDEVEKIVVQEKDTDGKGVDRALENYEKTLNETEKSLRVKNTDAVKAADSIVRRSADDYEQSIAKLILKAEDHGSDAKIKERLERAHEYTKEKLKPKEERDSKPEEKEEENNKNRKNEEKQDEKNSDNNEDD